MIKKLKQYENVSRENTQNNAQISINQNKVVKISENGKKKHSS